MWELPGAPATGPHEYVGTADYIAPEYRYRREPADARADIYSLGVVMYEMLTRKLPIGHFSPPSKAGRGNRRLDAIVLQCLAGDPKRRYGSAAELRDALGRGETRGLALTASVGAAVLAIAAGLVWIEKPGRHAGPAPAAQRTSAIALQPTTLVSPLPAVSPTTAVLSSPAVLPSMVVSPTTAVSPTMVVSPSTPPTTREGAIRGPFAEGEPGSFGPGAPPWMWGWPIGQRQGFSNPTRLDDRFGADRVVEVDLQHVSEAQRKSAIAELARDVGNNYSATARDDQCVVRLAPCDDVPGLAAKIHFGKVVEVNGEKRRIVVDMAGAGK